MTKLATDVSLEECAISHAPISPRSGPMTTVVVDAWCFSLPYDYSLCDVLGDHGCRVFLAGSEFLAGEWTRTASGVEAQFYRLSRGKKRQGVFAPLVNVDPDENCFTSTQAKNTGDNGSRFFGSNGSKRKSG